MDRNYKAVSKAGDTYVALLAEGVDRNLEDETMSVIIRVALLAEGVDRNSKMLSLDGCDAVSPSSQRAWIEMRLRANTVSPVAVALLAEGVDRNRRRGSS